MAKHTNGLKLKGRIIAKGGDAAENTITSILNRSPSYLTSETPPTHHLSHLQQPYPQAVPKLCIKFRYRAQIPYIFDEAFHFLNAPLDISNLLFNLLRLLFAVSYRSIRAM